MVPPRTDQMPMMAGPSEVSALVIHSQGGFLPAMGSGSPPGSHFPCGLSGRMLVLVLLLYCHRVVVLSPHRLQTTISLPAVKYPASLSMLLLLS